MDWDRSGSYTVDKIKGNVSVLALLCEVSHQCAIIEMVGCLQMWMMSLMLRVEINTQSVAAWNIARST